MYVYIIWIYNLFLIVIMYIHLLVMNWCFRPGAFWGKIFVKCYIWLLLLFEVVDVIFFVFVF